MKIQQAFFIGTIQALPTQPLFPIECMEYQVSNDSSLWFVYMLRCRDNSLYTGITTNLSQRLHEHNHSARGAKYTRGRRPVCLVFSEEQPSRSDAASREHAIKQLRKKEKESLIRELGDEEI